MKRVEKKIFKLTAVKIYVYTSFNNTIVTITDEFGNVIAWSSAGCCKFKGSKKGTPHAASIISRWVAEKVLLMIKGSTTYNVYADIFIKGPGAGAESSIRVLSSYFILNSISNITGIPHNGCRQKKARRV